ncbi:unnamed protein product [Diatraea saccharalis]|uniref:Uncharacterized protein n=1 Tax=Diatraea saccharalis TaxID=40085 RepID=A0A9N9MZN8_9NEOP|nr:unnamed protein product [Diatraea saccharalis]
MASINGRDQKIEQQRQLMEQKMKQKRQHSGMVQANDLRVGSAKRPISGSRSRELHGKSPLIYKLFSPFLYVLHFLNIFFFLFFVLILLCAFNFFATGYDGPMQFLMSPVNPDQVIPLQTNRISTYDGE